MSALSPLEILVLGTDTGVGKTAVAVRLVQALRARGRQVWVHKPVACGGWAQDQAEDARRLAQALGDGQPPETVCPFQYPEPASPHLAAGTRVPTLAQYRANLAAVRGHHDVIIEGVGGLLVPLTAKRETIADVVIDAPARMLGGPCPPKQEQNPPISHNIAERGELCGLIVCRPDLGTLNHTALTTNEARRRGIHILGLIINHAHLVADSLATRCVPTELAAVTGLPILAQLQFDSGTPFFADAGRSASAALAEAVLAAAHPKTMEQR
jgi:dethiobiotin synthetase